MAGGQTPIPRVPIQNPMFAGQDTARAEDQLTRTWIIFFERLAKLSERQLDTGGSVIGWDLQDTTPGTDVSDPIPSVPVFTPAACVVRIKVTDAVNDLTLDILQNGVSIFNTQPTIPAGTSTRDVQTFSDFIDGFTVADAADDFTINVISGGDWQVAVYLI